VRESLSQFFTHLESIPYTITSWFHRRAEGPPYGLLPKVLKRAHRRPAKHRKSMIWMLSHAQIDPRIFLSQKKKIDFFRKKNRFFFRKIWIWDFSAKYPLPIESQNHNNHANFASRSVQERSGAFRSVQKRPEALRSIQKHSEVLRSMKKHEKSWKIMKKSWKIMKTHIPKNHENTHPSSVCFHDFHLQERPGASRSVQKYPEAPRSTQKHPEAPRSTQKYSEVLRSMKNDEKSWKIMKNHEKSWKIMIFIWKMDPGWFFTGHGRFRRKNFGWWKKKFHRKIQKNFLVNFASIRMPLRCISWPVEVICPKFVHLTGEMKNHEKSWKICTQQPPTQLPGACRAFRSTQKSLNTRSEAFRSTQKHPEAYRST